MNYKIIETGDGYPDVLLFRDRDEDGNEIVKIHALGTQGQEYEYVMTDTVHFSEKDSAKSFIRDYSIKSAEIWCETNDMTYC